MPIDLLGPASTNAVTERPADNRALGSADTFFKDCTSASAGDGTKILAAWLNGMLQQTRRAIRGMGIAEDNDDDDMLLKAIQASGVIYAVDNGVANSIIVTPAPVMLGYRTGTVIFTRIAATNTGETVINVNGIGAKQVRTPLNDQLNAGYLRQGELVLLVYDGTAFLAIRHRDRLRDITALHRKTNFTTTHTVWNTPVLSAATDLLGRKTGNAGISIPEAGIYAVNAYAFTTTQFNGNMSMQLRLNGTTVIARDTTGVDNTTHAGGLSAKMITDFAANDVIDMQLTHDDNASNIVWNGAYLSVERIR